MPIDYKVDILLRRSRCKGLELQWNFNVVQTGNISRGKVAIFHRLSDSQIVVRCATPYVIVVTVSTACKIA